MRKKCKKGFTLVELLVVIAIIGILAVVAVPNLFKFIHKSKISELESDYSAIRSAVLVSYAEDNKIHHYGTLLSSEAIISNLDGGFDKSPIGGQYNLLPNKTYRDEVDNEEKNYMDEYKDSIFMVDDAGNYVRGDITKFELVLHIKGYDNYNNYGYPIVPDDLFKKMANDIGKDIVFCTKDLSAEGEDGRSDIFIGLIEKR